MKILRGAYLAMAVIAIACAVTTGCTRSFHEVKGTDLQRVWEQEARYADATWWYLGTSGSYHYLREDRPLISTRYKIRRDQVALVDVSEFPHGWSERRRVNLHRSNIQFDMAEMKRR
jgi:hypothetical protein